MELNLESLITALMSGDTSDLSDDLYMLQSIIQDSFTAQINRLEEDHLHLHLTPLDDL